MFNYKCYNFFYNVFKYYIDIYIYISNIIYEFFKFYQ